jgi:hypothetical protein
MVTDLVRAALLEDGLLSVIRVYLFVLVPTSWLVKLITLLTAAADWGCGLSDCAYNLATSS